jgi:hypothetical protein
MVTTAVQARPAAPRRKLTDQDRRSAHLADLHGIRSVLVLAQQVVAEGWVRGAWFTYRDERGDVRRVGGQPVRVLAERPVTGACLVGAVVHAGGGPSAIHTQSVQRALDLVWHALRRRGDEPVQWCPGPAARAAHVRDLTRWNDDPGRTAEDVASLLRTAERAVVADITTLRRAPA